MITYVVGNKNGGGEHFLPVYFFFVTPPADRLRARFESLEKRLRLRRPFVRRVRNIAVDSIVWSSRNAYK
ncbi:hypothetical protein U1Q18_052002 [Sarracenia purpurea var. burkii]